MEKALCEAFMLMKKIWSRGNQSGAE